MEQKYNFILEDIKVTDLQLNIIDVDFDQQDFANTLWTYSDNIRHDQIADDLFKTGATRITQSELNWILDKQLNWGDLTHRAACALEEHVNHMLYDPIAYIDEDTEQETHIHRLHTNLLYADSFGRLNAGESPETLLKELLLKIEDYEDQIRLKAS